MSKLNPPPKLPPLSANLKLLIEHYFAYRDGEYIVKAEEFPRFLAQLEENTVQPSQVEGYNKTAEELLKILNGNHIG